MHTCSYKKSPLPVYNIQNYMYTYTCTCVAMIQSWPLCYFHLIVASKHSEYHHTFSKAEQHKVMVSIKEGYTAWRFAHILEKRQSSNTYMPKTMCNGAFKCTCTCNAKGVTQDSQLISKRRVELPWAGFECGISSLQGWCCNQYTTKAAQ